MPPPRTIAIAGDSVLYFDRRLASGIDSLFNVSSRLTQRVSKSMWCILCDARVCNENWLTSMCMYTGWKCAKEIELTMRSKRNTNCTSSNFHNGDDVKAKCRSVPFSSLLILVFFFFFFGVCHCRRHRCHSYLMHVNVVALKSLQCDGLILCERIRNFKRSFYMFLSRTMTVDARLGVCKWVEYCLFLSLLVFAYAVCSIFCSLSLSLCRSSTLFSIWSLKISILFGCEWVLKRPKVQFKSLWVSKSP